MRRGLARGIAIILTFSLFADPALAVAGRPASGLVPQACSVFTHQAFTQRLGTARWMPDAFKSFFTPRLARLHANLLYGIPTATATWFFLDRFNIATPGHGPHAVFLLAYLIVQTVLAQWLGRRPGSSTVQAELSAVPRPWKWTLRLLILTIGIVTLIYPTSISQWAPSGYYITYHDIWAWIGTVLGMTVFIQSWVAWHQARFWGDQSGSAARAGRAIWFASRFLYSIGLLAGVAHYVFANDSFYNIRCFLVNTSAGLILLGVRALYSRAIRRTLPEEPEPAIQPKKRGRSRRFWIKSLAALGGVALWREEQDFRPKEAEKDLTGTKEISPPQPAPEGSVFPLADGRKLGYVERGAPEENNPGLIRFILLPGGLESRLVNYLFRDETLFRLNVRLYIIEPPEIGLSSPHPNAWLKDWADDVDQFALKRFQGKDFSIMGHSAGGLVAYSFARAAKVKGLKSLSLVSSLPPLSSPGDWPSYPNEWTKAFLGARFAPALAMPFAKATRDKIMAWSPYYENMVVSPENPPGDQAVLKYPGIEAMLKLARQDALAQGEQALLENMRTVTTSLPEAINDMSKILVLIFHGEEDPDIPLKKVKEFAKTFPNVVTGYYPIVGHHFIRIYFDYVMEKAVKAHKGQRPVMTPLDMSRLDPYLDQQRRAA